MTDWTCNQDGCDNPGAFRYTWPGKDEQAICTEHYDGLKQVSHAVGLHLQFIPIEQEDGKTNLEAALGRLSRKIGAIKADVDLGNAMLQSLAEMSEEEATRMGWDIPEMLQELEEVLGAQKTRLELLQTVRDAIRKKAKSGRGQ